MARQSPEAVSRLTFRVSDAGRCPKVVGARTRGVGGITYGDLDFGPVRGSGRLHSGR